MYSLATYTKNSAVLQGEQFTQHASCSKVCVCLLIHVWNSTEPPEGDFIVGYEVRNDRKSIHDEMGAVIVPNHLEDVRYDGHITAWNFYAKLPGNITLLVSELSEWILVKWAYILVCYKLLEIKMWNIVCTLMSIKLNPTSVFIFPKSFTYCFPQVLRQSPSNLQEFSIVDQVELSIEEAGQYTVDIENTPNPQWAGKVILLQCFWKSSTYLYFKLNTVHAVPIMPTGQRSVLWVLILLSGLLLTEVGILTCVPQCPLQKIPYGTQLTLIYWHHFMAHFLSNGTSYWSNFFLLEIWNLNGT